MVSVHAAAGCGFSAIQIFHERPSKGNSGDALRLAQLLEYVRAEKAASSIDLLMRGLGTTYEETPQCSTLVPLKSLLGPCTVDNIPSTHEWTAIRHTGTT